MAILFLCIQIFLFRIIDVSLGVIRTILSVRRKAFLASMVGFFEVLIWFLIIRNALSIEVEGLFVAFSYALGFATGTFVGGLIAKQLIKIKINVQIITSNRDEKILKTIRAHGFPATVIEATGSSEEKSERYLLFVEIDSTSFKSLKNIVLSVDNRAFIFVNELTSSVNGFFYTKK
jgi:uncharacterized protein YebE (UPF0316 family)